MAAKVHKLEFPLIGYEQKVGLDLKVTKLIPPTHILVACFQIKMSVILKNSHLVKGFYSPSVSH